MDKKTSLTVYKNEMNAVSFRKFTSVEMDLFFTICTQMRDQGLETVVFDFKTLKNVSQYRGKNLDRFISDLDHTYSKMLTLNIKRGLGKKGFERFVLFTGFKVDVENKQVEITINPKFSYLLNEISVGFTKFELQEFTKLRSSYSKTVFRFLKQFRQTGFWKVHINDFRVLLDIPDAYPISEITRRVFKPIHAELSPLFSNLKIKKIKEKNKNKIEYLEFSFTPEDDVKENGSKIFRDAQTGAYYEKDIEHFTPQEIKKTFP